MRAVQLVPQLSQLSLLPGGLFLLRSHGSLQGGMLRIMGTQGTPCHEQPWVIFMFSV